MTNAPSGAFPALGTNSEGANPNSLISSSDTLYGTTYLVALAIGIFMIGLLYAPWFRAPIWRKVYVGGFPVMFTLMVLMRFGV